MKVSIVILNFNGKHWLEKFLPNVLENLCGAELIIADNASTDDSISFLESNYPAIAVIQLEENTGYAGGYNRALKQVDADIFVLLNSDIELSENWLYPIVNTFEKHPEIAALQPKVKSYDAKDYFEHAGASGGFLDKYGYPLCRGRIFHLLEKDEQQYENPVYTFWATGACLCIRKDDFLQVGGFDADFFAHMEEIDLCWRLQLHGRKSAVVPSSVVYHVGGGTLNTSSPKKTYLNFRNNLFMLYKNLPAHALFRKMFFRLILDGIAGIKFLAGFQFSHCLAVIHAHFSFYGKLGNMRKKRRAAPKKKALVSLEGCYPHSIVWDFFIRKKTDWFLLDLSFLKELGKTEEQVGKN